MNVLGNAVYTTYVVLWEFSDSKSMLAIPLHFTLRSVHFEKLEDDRMRAERCSLMGVKYCQKITPVVWAIFSPLLITEFQHSGMQNVEVLWSVA